MDVGKKKKDLLTNFPWELERETNKIVAFKQKQSSY